MKPLPWAVAIIRQGRAVGPLPRYGSQTWHMLAGDDPRRVAALVVAAEAWRDHCSADRIAEELIEEIVAAEANLIGRFREASWDVSTARDWDADAYRLSHEELVERRTPWQPT